MSLNDETLKKDLEDILLGNGIDKTFLDQGKIIQQLVDYIRDERWQAVDDAFNAAGL